jgi:hypothetical protein
MQLLSTLLLSAGVFMLLPTAPSLAETLDATETMWDCSQADGTSRYTNQEGAGCHAMTLTPLSIVPDGATWPAMPSTAATPPRESAPTHGRVSARADRQVPDWARDWHTSIAPSGSVQEEVCSLYSEWMHLVQKTRGGMFFGSDPSYGGNLSARNQRGPSYSFYDNTRYVTLSRLFGLGFVPVRCP